jgi:hypothetical protein
VAHALVRAVFALLRTHYFGYALVLFECHPLQARHFVHLPLETNEGVRILYLAGFIFRENARPGAPEN